MNLNGQDWPTYTVGYGQAAYADDELGDAAETARLMASRHAHGADQPDGVRAGAAADRLGRRGADRRPRRSCRCTSSASAPVRTSRWRWSGRGRTSCSAATRATSACGTAAPGGRFPRACVPALEAGLRRLPRNEALKRGVHSLGVEDRLRRYQNVFSLLPGEDVDGLFRPGVLPEGAGDEVLNLWADLEPEIAASDELGGFQVLEIASSLPDELLMYADKLSMAHSLEVRVPYLDREVVEFAQRLPARFKIRRGERKWVHRRVCEKFLPAEILARKKRGFAVNVVDEWFRGSLGAHLAAISATRRRGCSSISTPPRSGGCSTSTAPAGRTTTRCCSAWSCSRMAAANDAARCRDSC